MDFDIYIQLIFLIIVNVVFTFLGGILNTFVFISIWRSSQLRRKLSYFMIMVLSFFDLMTAITSHTTMVIYLALWLTERYQILLNMDSYTSFLRIFIGCSFQALLLMCIERYIGVTYPFFHRTTLTKGKLLKLLVILFLLPSPLLIISVNNLLISRSVATAIYLAFLCPTFLFLNGKLFIVSRRMRRSQEMKMGKVQNVSSCLLAVACFVLCCIPSSVYFAFHATENSDTSNTRISRVWISTIFAMNSTFNSIIFYWKNRVLRVEGMKVWNSLKYSIFGL